MGVLGLVAGCSQPFSIQDRRSASSSGSMVAGRLAEFGYDNVAVLDQNSHAFFDLPQVGGEGCF